MKGILYPLITSITEGRAPNSSHTWRKSPNLPPTDEATEGGGGRGGGGSQFFFWPPFPPREERPYPFPLPEEEEEEVADVAGAARA